MYRMIMARLIFASIGQSPGSIGFVGDITSKCQSLPLRLSLQKPVDRGRRPTAGGKPEEYFHATTLELVH